MKRALPALLCLVLLALLGGCASDPTAPGNGSVTVRLTDGPIDLSGVSAVNVTLDGMLLFEEDQDPDPDTGGMMMDMPAVSAGEGLTLNLLDFQNGQTVTIAELDAPAGDYAKLRMLISEAWLVRDDDGDPETPEIEESIFVPSGKVDIPIPFTLTGGENLEVTIDFDAAGSVQVNGTPGNHEYILRPVITPVSVTRR